MKRVWVTGPNARNQVEPRSCENCHSSEDCYREGLTSTSHVTLKLNS